MISKKKKNAMIDTQLNDTLMMIEVTGGDPELLAIDTWLRDTFEVMRDEHHESNHGPEDDLLPS